jgi:hypothetical protein
MLEPERFMPVEILTGGNVFTARNMTIKRTYIIVEVDSGIKSALLKHAKNINYAKGFWAKSIP